MRYLPALAAFWKKKQMMPSKKIDQTIHELNDLLLMYTCKIKKYRLDDKIIWLSRLLSIVMRHYFEGKPHFQKCLMNIFYFSQALFLDNIQEYRKEL